jgi:hypothetical protein
MWTFLTAFSSPMLLTFGAFGASLYSVFDRPRQRRRVATGWSPRRLGGVRVTSIVLGTIGVAILALFAGFLYLLSQVPSSC